MFAPYRVIKRAPYPLRRIDSGTALVISKDGGAQNPAVNTPVETPSSSGIYYNELTATEMDADHIFYRGLTGDVLSDGVLIPEPSIDSGVAQAGTSTTITLRSGGPAFDLTNTLIEFVRGTSSGSQPRLIIAYDTATKIATFRPNVGTPPDNTTVYIVTPVLKTNPMQLDGNSLALQYMSEFWANGVYRTGTFATGCTTTILQTGLLSVGTQALRGAIIMPLSGPDAGLCRPIVDYNTVNGQITVSPGFPTAQANGVRFAVFGYAG